MYKKVCILFCLLNTVLFSNIYAQNYPAVFDPSNLSGSNGFIAITSETQPYKLGNEVRFIGDINNDGFDDIAIGNGLATANSFEVGGKAYIIFGTSSPLPVDLDLTTLDGTNGFTVQGAVKDERLGETIAGPGDINGDGIDDLIIGSSNSSGSSMVLYGSNTFAPVYTKNDLDGNNGFIIDFSGVNQVDKLGDVNGDGINDFIVARPHWNERGTVVFGRSTNFPATIDLTWIDGVNGFETAGFSGSRPAYNAGGAGDINNDGYDDILIGNWASDYYSIPEQVSYAFFGKSTFNKLEQLTTVDGSDGFRIDNHDNGFLTFVGPLGDINGDGIDDCFSENDIIFGSDDPFPAYLEMANLDGSNGFVLEEYVLCAAPAGDLNLDGVDDFIVRGVESYVVFGKTSGFSPTLNRSTLDGTNGFQIYGINTSNIGRPMDGGGDFNGDGLADFIIGDNSGYHENGCVYVVYGGDHVVEFNTGYPTVTNILSDRLSLVCNVPENGTVYYGVYAYNFSITDPDVIINGTSSILSGNFAINTPNTDISRVIGGLSSDTMYDVYAVFIDDNGNKSDVAKIDNVRTTSLCIDVPCSERDALIALYNSTNGSNWDNNTNWLSAQPVDDWYGVTVSGGHVTSINLNGNNLNGSLTKEFTYLPYLEILNLSQNPNLSGTIPTDLFYLTHMKEIDFEGSGFQGNIPTVISNMSGLEKLNLKSNQLTGFIPPGTYSLSKLTLLDLSDNQLEGFIVTSSIGNLGSLVNLDLSDNSFEGNIHANIGNLIHLETIHLENNKFDGTVPASLASLPDLRDLYLNDNDLSGILPDFTSSPSFNGTLAIQNNAFQFGDFEDQWNAYQSQLTDFIISPQANIGYATTIDADAGDGIFITTTVSGNHNKYQWYKNNAPISGATNAALSLTEVRTTAAGEYYCLITNDVVTDLTLRRNSVQVNIAPDIDPPIIVCPEDQALGCNTVLPDYTSLANVIDDIDRAPVVTQSPAPGSAFTDGMTITLTATDFSSNKETCTFVVNLAEDKTPPQIVCPKDQILNPGDVIPDYTGLATSTDNCSASPVITQSPPAGTSYTDGMKITLTSTDDSNNSESCFFYIYNEDDEDPVITDCPLNMTLSCENQIPDYTRLITVTDNIDPNPVVTQSPAPGSAFTDGMTITLTATDFSSNKETCTFIVNLGEDKTPPQIVCPGDQILNSGDVVPDYTLLATSTDNCSPAPVITQSPASGTSYTEGMKITLTSTDDNGNSESCSFYIHTQDDEDPVITSCPSDIILSCGDLIPDYTGHITVTDNIDPAPVITQTPVANTIATEDLQVELLATDNSGNYATCRFNISVESLTLVDAGANVVIEKGTSTELVATAQGSGSYLWTPASSLSDPDISDPIASPVTTTTYKVVFTNETGCSDSDEITVTVAEERGIKNKYGISPNGDGIRDDWQIDTIEDYPGNIVSIYNRWGNLVFEVEGYNNTTTVFEGKANRLTGLGSGELPDGTYFFSIKLSENEASENGFIVIKR